MGEDVGEIDVFPTGRTLARERPTSAPGPEGADSRDHPDDQHRDRQDRVGYRSFHARPGHRPGATPGAAGIRAGGDSDIVRPLLVPPRAASRIVLSGEVFARPVPHLVIDVDHVDMHFLVWAAMVVGDHVRPVPATLHLLGSPSMVVTVLELVPARRLRWGGARFVRYGVEAVDELAHRIERAARGATQRSGTGRSPVWTTDSRCVLRVNAT